MIRLTDQVGHAEICEIKYIKKRWGHVKSFQHAVTYWAYLQLQKLSVDPSQVVIEFKGLEEKDLFLRIIPGRLPDYGANREERENDFKLRIRLWSYIHLADRLAAGIIPAQDAGVQKVLIRTMRKFWEIHSAEWEHRPYDKDCHLRYFSWIFGEMMNQWRPEQDAMIITDLLSFAAPESYKHDENNWIADLVRRRLNDGDWHPRAIVAYLERHPDAHEILKRKMLQTLAKKIDPEIMLEAIDIANLKGMLEPRT